MKNLLVLTKNLIAVTFILLNLQMNLNAAEQASFHGQSNTPIDTLQTISGQLLIGVIKPHDKDHFQVTEMSNKTQSIALQEIDFIKYANGKKITFIHDAESGTEMIKSIYKIENQPIVEEVKNEKKGLFNKLMGATLIVLVGNAAVIGGALGVVYIAIISSLGSLNFNMGFTLS